MIKGLLITNAFLVTPKFREIYNMITAAFAARGISLDEKSNAEAALTIPDKEVRGRYDFVLMWDKDVLLARHFENAGVRVFNSASAIEIADDKCKTAVALETSGLKMPKTYIAPFAYKSADYLSDAFISQLNKNIDFPCIMKQAKGSFGQQVYMVDDENEVIKLIERYDITEFLLQEIITSSIGCDCRIQTVGGKVVAAVKRIGREGDFRANVTNGGKMYKFDAPESFKKAAVTASEALKLDFCGVDILFGENGEPVICEVNSNAHFKNLYDATGINTAEKIADYIKNIYD